MADSQPQYDTIGEKYDFVKQFPTARIETSNLRAAVAPHVSSARVLDLACGTGHYSRLLLEWGATSVVGVDLSPAMVAIAEQARPPELVDRLQFRVGDGVSLGKLDAADEGFDLVVGAWLLNYAGDEDEMAAMFATISANLKGSRGVFVGLVGPPCPAAELDAFAAAENERMRHRKEALRVTVRYYARNERMPQPDGGWRVEVATYDERGEEEVFKFTTYHLPTEVFERAARRGGMEGKLEWRPVRMMEEIREQAVREFGEEFWREYFEEIGPHFGLLVVHKGGGVTEGGL